MQATPPPLPRFMIGPDSQPRRRDHVLAQKSGDAVVLLDPESGHYYRLDEVGARIWELADGSRTVSAIGAALADEYDAPPERIAADAIELLSELASEELIVDAG